jgi:hypothetical protein
MQTLQADVAIIGGGAGAIAATRALLDHGLRVIMTEEFAWIGGQFTSQALCVPDEYHDPIFEGGGCTRRYLEFREELRDYYKNNFKLSKKAQSSIHLSPGAGPKSISAEPQVALRVIMDGFEEAIKSGQLQIFTGFIPTAAEREGNRVKSVTCAPKYGQGDEMRISADFFLCGDETGELYPLLQIGYRQGAESRAEFEEPHAPLEAAPDSLQSFTFCIALQYVPGGDFTIPKPDDYAYWKEKHGQHFYLGSPGAIPEDPAQMFRLKTGRGGIRLRPAFYYRSMVEKEVFDDSKMPYSSTVINVTGNDYCYRNFIGKSRAEQEEILEEAHGLSRAYLYWLQTEAPRDDGDGFGYPEMRPMPEATGTDSGLAMAPYIREGRRLKACRTIIEQDISTEFQRGSRAQPFMDSVGVGCFIIDIHQRVGAEGVSQMARPYQIPLGSLVSPELENFAVAAKGIGVTQVTNGAYRLHAIEWNIGEAAGELAAYCLQNKITDPNLQGRKLFDFQRTLLDKGFTLYWYEDLAIDHPGFAAVQLLSLKGIWPGNPRHLRFNPNYSLVRAMGVFNYCMDKLAEAGVPIEEFRHDQEMSICTRLYDMAHRLVCYLDEVGWPEFAYSDEAPVVKKKNWDIFNDFIPEPMDDRELPGQPSRIGEG